MSIKPVAWRRSKLLYGDKEHYYGKNKLWKDDVPLYAIPDTHRVVSVETLQRWRSGLISGNQAYCLVPPAEIQAIIEDKP